MPRARIAIRLDERALAEIDRLVREGMYPNRTTVIESAIIEYIDNVHRTILARETAKLDRGEEQTLADEGYAGEGEWLDE